MRINLIKTIVRKLGNADAFDNAVNSALKEGWQLVKRETIIQGQPVTPEQYYSTMLYAELTKEVDIDGKID